MTNPVRLLRDWAGQIADTLYTGSDQDWLVSQGIADNNIIQARFTAEEVSLGYLTTFYGMSSDDPQNFNLVLNDTYPVGTMITVVQYGDGAVTIVAPTGVTIRGSASETVAQYDTIMLLKDGANSYLAGNFVYTGPIADFATETYVDDEIAAAVAPLATTVALDGRLSAAQRMAIDALTGASDAAAIVAALQAV